MDWLNRWDLVRTSLAWGTSTLMCNLNRTTRWALGMERIMALLDKSLLPAKDRAVAIIPIFENSDGATPGMFQTTT